MPTQDLALMRAVGGKVDYLNTRQRIISQNIANADTPGYRPQDLTDADFGRLLRGVTGDKRIRIESTNSLHIPAHGEVPTGDERKSRVTYEVAPAGNSVIIEEQMIKANRTSMDYNLMLNVYRKNVGLLRTAIGAPAQ